MLKQRPADRHAIAIRKSFLSYRLIKLPLS